MKNAYIIIAYVKLGGITLSCDRCDDVHVAQRAGKQSDECKCSCHKGNIFNPNPQFQPPYYQPAMPYTGDPIPPQYETTCGPDDLFKFRFNPAEDDT